MGSTRGHDGRLPYGIAVKTSAPFSVKGIDHVVLRVSDLNAARHFYEDVLGCQMEREQPDLGLYQFRAGRSLIDLVIIGGRLGGSTPPVNGQGNQDHFCITLSPFDEEDLRAWLSLHGVEASGTADRYGAEGVGPSIYIQDPDGNTVELKAAR